MLAFDVSVHNDRNAVCGSKILPSLNLTKLYVGVMSTRHSLDPSWLEDPST